MIAAVCSWHEHHELAANEIDRRLARREKMIVAACVPSNARLRRYSPSMPTTSQTLGKGFAVAIPGSV